MPAVTTLAFYRNKQSIKSFENDRPKSLASVRQAARDGLTTTEHNLAHLEREFLGDHPSFEAMIVEEMLGIKILLPLAGAKEIAHKLDLVTVGDRVMTLTDAATNYTDPVNGLRAAGAHVCKYCPSAFQQVIAEIEKIMECAERYCLSFYPGDVRTKPDPHFETAYRYELQRKERINEVMECLRAINETAQTFGSRGLDLTKFSFASQDLARKTGCGRAPFLLLFPEACTQIREAMHILNVWMEEDKEYTDALANDIQGLVDEEDELGAKQREQFESMTKLSHQLEIARRDLSSLSRIVLDQRGKMFAAEDLQEEAQVEITKIEAKIEMMRKSLYQLKREDYKTGREYRRVLGARKRALQDLKKELPEYQRALKHASERVAWFEAREEQITVRQAVVRDIEWQTKKVRNALRDTEEHMGRVKNNLVQLRHIRALRTNPSSLKRIFHGLPLLEPKTMAVFTSPRGMPLSPRQLSPRLEMEKEDPLSRAIRIISHHIDQDWTKLYYALPFYPPRGVTDVENDLVKIDKKFVRGSRNEMALASLNTWRRLHTRANTDAIRAALVIIDREDVVHILDGKRTLGPRREMTMPVGGVPPLSPISRLIHRSRQQAAGIPLTQAGDMQVRSHTTLPLITSVSMIG